MGGLLSVHKACFRVIRSRPAQWLNQSSFLFLCRHVLTYQLNLRSLINRTVNKIKFKLKFLTKDHFITLPTVKPIILLMYTCITSRYWIVIFSNISLPKVYCKHYVIVCLKRTLNSK